MKYIVLVLTKTQTTGKSGFFWTGPLSKENPLKEQSYKYDEKSVHVGHVRERNVIVRSYGIIIGSWLK